MARIDNDTVPRGSWWTERHLTLAGLAVGIVIVASLSVLSYRALLEQERHIASVNHTHEVLITIQSVLTLLKDAETGQRGYLLTQDERYLEPYHAALPEIVTMIERLRRLTVDNPEQQPRLEELQSLALEKLNELRETAELAARAPDAAVRRVRTDTGRRIMDRIRSVARVMEESEEDLLRVRQSERQRFSTTRLQPAVLVGSLLALSLLAISLGLVVRDSRAREQAALLQEANQQLLDRSAALTAANKELEAFSYSVSHDLRAPLRAVDGFSRILIEDYGATLDPEIQRYLAIVRKGARQMGQLIDDLLEFSRLGRHPLQRSPVNLMSVAQDAVADLRAEQEGRKIELTIGDLPTCQADRRLLKQVFVNLLSNALKYTRPRDVAKIEVGCRKDGEPGPPVLYVRDNGVGFDMQYAPKLFGVFQRLHRAEDFEGTGVGLAIVQRIVHRHGGRAWAEGGIDRGATFSFTLEGDVR